MLRVLANLPKTLVLLLAPPDFSQWDSIPDKGVICSNSLQIQCSCLYSGGSVTNNKKKFRKLQISYTRALHMLAGQYDRKDFGVEVLPSLQGLPAKEMKGYTKVASKRGLSHDCFHFNERTHSMVGFEAKYLIIFMIETQTHLF